MYDEIMNSEAGSGPLQYCIEDDDHKQMSATFVHFSPASTADWWSVLKTDDVPSPKDGWSSDSDSELTVISGCSNGNIDNGSSLMLGLSDVKVGTNEENSLSSLPSVESINNNNNNNNNNNDDNNNNSSSSSSSSSSSGGSNSKNGKSTTKKKKSKDTPAINKPAQVVARRNARERRRVQAVNWAFQRLRKVVPLEENKSKRMSKVKTLQHAIEYINQLEDLLQFTNQHTNEADLLADIFSDLQQQQQQLQQSQQQQQHDQPLSTSSSHHQMKLDSPSSSSSASNEFTFRVPASFYTQLIGAENEEN